MSYLPEIYKEFVKQYPEVSKAYDALADSCHEHGPLDKKTRRLVKLGIAVGLGSEGAVKSCWRLPPSDFPRWLQL